MLFSASLSAKPILIIGDSTSLGAMRYIKEALPCVVHAPGNSRDTAFIVSHLGEWAYSKHYSVIYFNSGLWDIARRIPTPTDPWKLDPTNQAPTALTLEEYRLNLIVMVALLRGFQPEAKLIFATSTDVPPHSIGRKPKDLNAYNAAAAEVMQDLHVEVDDRHGFMLPYAYLHTLSEDNKVHYTGAGYQVMASHVVDVLQAHGGC